MRVLGIILMLSGSAWLLVAFNMDTSVPTGGGPYLPSRVENIGLIAQRQNHLLVSGLITLIGSLMAIFGPRGAPPVGARSEAPVFAPSDDEPMFPRDLSVEGYRLWLAERYAIKRNEVFDRFVFDHRIFESLDEALLAAHALELAKVSDQNEQQRLAYAREQAETEARRKSDEQARKVVQALFVLMIIAACCVALYDYVY